MSTAFYGLSDLRILAAAALVLSYLLLTAYWLRPLWRRTTITPVASQTTLIAYATQTGFAQQLAIQTARSLESAGASIRVASIADVSPDDLAHAERALFIVSTTGEGDAPDPAARFVRQVLSGATELTALRYGLLALGDREYDNFCAFGRKLDQWLQKQGAKALFDVIEVDNGDDGALRHWQHNLSLAFDAPDLQDWETPSYEAWTLADRVLLNPGSAGDACYHIVFKPPADSLPTWQAGDIAEIDPYNSHAKDAAERHPHREYSIASIAADRELHLLVRQMRRPTGELGLGSSWLTRDAPLRGPISLRIRSNPNFQLPAADVPLILIGNGTGIAGLRALLRARAERGQHRNWLLFGERNAAHDRFYASDIANWQKTGHLPEIDLVFSRDQPLRRYIQHRLKERAADLRAWIDDGAYIYVCGSLEGMAPGVHEVLIEALGPEHVDELLASGRYRRDVY